MPKTTTRAPKDDTSEEIRARHAGEGPWSGVDDQTQILTARGWLTVHEVQAGDLAYVLDTDSRTARFEPIISVTRAEPRPRLLRFTELGGFSAFTTHAHRWPSCGEQAFGSRFSYRTVSSIPKHARLFRMVDRSDAPQERLYQDAFVELVAWYWCEGTKYFRHDRPKSTIACICQSYEVNPDHCRAIETALEKVWPGQWRYAERDNGQARFNLRVGPSRALFRVTGKDKEPTPGFLRDLTADQAQLFIDRCLDGDGTINVGNGGQRVWYQLSPQGMAQFQMACALAGIPTNAHESTDYGNRYGRPPIAVTLLKNRMAVPWMSLHVKSYGYKPGAPRTNAIDEWREHDGLVWNMETPSGTWLARRNWSVYFTGAGLACEPSGSGSVAA